MPQRVPPWLRPSLPLACALSLVAASQEEAVGCSAAFSISSNLLKVLGGLTHLRWTEVEPMAVIIGEKLHLDLRWSWKEELANAGLPEA